MTYSYVFKGLSIHIARFHSQNRTGGGGLIRKTKIPVQELWLKMGKGLVGERGRIRGYTRKHVLKTEKQCQLSPKSISYTNIHPNC